MYRENRAQIRLQAKPESKNRRPHLSLCYIILRLKRGKRGSCSYFLTSFKPPDLTYVRFRLKRFKGGHTLRRCEALLDRRGS